LASALSIWHGRLAKPRSRSDWTETLVGVGAAVVSIGLPLSIFLISVGQWLIVLGWIFHPGLGKRLSGAAQKPIWWCFLGLFGIQALGMVWSSNTAYGLHDLRMKLPLLLLPLCLGSFPKPSTKTLSWFLRLFVLATFTSTLISFGLYLGVGGFQWHDIRAISPLVSHIRLSLMISICMGWFLFDKKIIFQHTSASIKWLGMIWLVVFLLILQSITGLALIVLLLLVWACQSIYRGKRWGWVPLAILILGLGLAGTQIYQSQQAYFANRSGLELPLKPLTANGRPYLHNLQDQATEEGFHVGWYQAPFEYEREWAKRSGVDIDGKDAKGQHIRYTLLRFLTSKGLTKDSVGVWALSTQEISHIEGGQTNALRDEQALSGRLHSIWWEYQNFRLGGLPNGHSLFMRLWFARTGWSIWKQHPLIGVGTGDVNDAFLEAYAQQPEPLDKPFWLRSHNQYITLGVALGWVGVLCFALMYAFIGYSGHRISNVFALLPLFILWLSFAAEDTLETSTGACLAAWIHGVILMLGKKNPTESTV
jgi:hypothetical protein